VSLALRLRSGLKALSKGNYQKFCKYRKRWRLFMEFLHQWYGEDSCACTYSLVDKKMNAALLTDTVELHLNICQV
jgi:hypothetical protein